VRRNWKTKNYNPEDNPLIDLSSTDEEDYGNETISREKMTITTNKDNLKIEEVIDEEEINEGDNDVGGVYNDGNEE
jgi:hypothetical protein